MRELFHQADLCIIGGGMSGLCCAIAAARHGLSVLLMQDRPVLGGNASSEIRMHIGGAHGKDNREGGIIEEIFLENFYFNHGLKHSLWDSVLYGKAIEERNLTLLLNTTCQDAKMEGDRIVSVRGWQLNTETYHTVTASYFADCSGDSILAPLTGAAVMYGREAKSDFGETIPPDVADQKTMGMSCLFQIRETDHYVPFTPPSWAYTYETDEDLPYKDHHKNDNYWWIEVGGMGDCIHDADECRDELLKICYGVWDHMKNKGDHGVDNWEMEWIGFLPGKRESRRYIGKYIVTQNDVESAGKFEDIVAYGGWSMDDHFPEGFYWKKSYPTIFHPAPSPWGLPLRCMIARDIENLVFAGRNISVTHAALSSARVMATCSILGQALGTAVAQAIHSGVHISEIDVPLLQQTLMDDDLYLPGHTRAISPLALSATVSAPVVIDGHDRGEEHLWIGKAGDSITYTFPCDIHVDEVRLVFDSNFNRNYDNLPCNYPLVQERFKLPHTLITSYILEGTKENGEKVAFEIKENHQRFVRHTLNWDIKTLRLIPLTTNGAEDFRIFAFEVK